MFTHLVTDQRLTELCQWAVGDDCAIDREMIATILDREQIIPMRGQLEEVMAEIRRRAQARDDPQRDAPQQPTLARAGSS